jgi:hypothetical protein
VPLNSAAIRGVDGDEQIKLPSQTVRLSFSLPGRRWARGHPGIPHKQVGEWTTYDAKGKVVKITKMRSPAT